MSIFFCHKECLGSAFLVACNNVADLSASVLAEIPLIVAKGRIEDRPDGELRFRFFQKKGVYIRIRGLVR
jgi:hypothetical protein